MPFGSRWTLRSAVLLGLLLPGTPGLQGQAPPALVIGQRDSLVSKVMGEERKLLIYLPDGYARGKASYPVIYLLDGDGHFHHTTGIIRFLTDQGRMPEAILVAIPNTDRTRDLTPVTTVEAAQFPTAGGAQRFLRFMREELFPHVEAHYRSAGLRVLIGHSFGGLFAVEALETQPEMFQAYVVISPSLWWNGGELVRRAPDDLKRHPDLKARVYMATGDEGDHMLAGARDLAAVLDSAGLPGLHAHFQFMPNEDHGSNPHRTTYDGLEWVFADFRLKEPELVALFEQGVAAVDRHFAQLSASYGYSITTPEALINRLGYYYLQNGKGDLAIAAFQENVHRFPKSANTYDSLGDGYAQTGRLQEAAASYRKAVEIGQPTGDPVVPFSRGKLVLAERKLAAGNR